jgi:hypothetical protein
MPFVRISLRAGRSQEFRRLLGDCVYRAMLETMNVPSAPQEELIYDPDCLGVHRTDGVIFVQVTLNVGARSNKASFMPAVALLKTSWTSDPKTS